ncbi:helix-turn-helix domain-containing protein [Clostridium beijerinckii]|uniref:helix-turn-helix domain-containing protein n=1 Tax=Clostridium beijerinckii TaxID=1520 RepID=UPI0003D2B218|nr:helix-turn-helix transcriptional regulator [Clostridium beijerinckii]ALB48321.1 XRE family transcriptional regulator [Clostridium beijerinckii NRRL B-598]
MNERIKIIRKNEKLSQSEFGKKLEVSRDVINNLENGRVEPKPLMINYICDVFNVNKEWLITGKGEIYKIPEENEILTEALAKISLTEKKELKEIVTKLPKLNEKYIDLINKLIDGLIKEN